MLLYRSLVVFLMAALSGGCINSSTLVKVKPDGAGTIEQTLLMNAATLKTMMATGGMQGQMQQKIGAFNEEEMKKAAEKMGKGVKLVSVTPMNQGGFEGAKAIFSFENINDIRVDQDPNIGAAGGPMSATSGSGGSPVRFKFDRGASGSTLTVTFDDKRGTAPAAEATPAGPAPTVDPAMMEMVKSMFQGFKVAIDLEVEGKIVKTNADYVNGSRITLLEIDMGELLQDTARLTSLQSAMKPGASIADIKPLLKDVKGVKINQPVVTIEYR